MDDDSRRKAKEAAENAACNRCGVVILSERSAVGTVTGVIESPATFASMAFALCGKCGLALREFLSPSLADDPFFQFAKTELLTRWE